MPVRYVPPSQYMGESDRELGPVVGLDHPYLKRSRFPDPSHELDALLHPDTVRRPGETPSRTQIDRRIYVDPFTYRGLEVDGIDLDQRPGKRGFRTSRVVVGSFPGRAFLRQVAPVQGPLYRGEGNPHSLAFQCVMHHLSAPTPLQSFVDDLRDDLARQRQRMVVWFG